MRQLRFRVMIENRERVMTVAPVTYNYLPDTFKK